MGSITVTDGFYEVSLKGKRLALQAIRVGPKAVVVSSGTFLRIGRIHDEFWMESKDLPKPEEVVARLKSDRNRPDLFTFTQRLPDTVPHYPYRLEWENLAVVNCESHERWFAAISHGARYAIRRSAREKVRTEVSEYTDKFVKGICSIYNETPIRQGKKFWHYRKPFELVKRDNMTYLDRSVYIGAFIEEELVGFLKLVFNNEVASIMQILAKESCFSKCPTNALLSKAVEVCEERKAKYLTYEKYVYGRKRQNGLTEFKRNNGFRRIDVPRYYVPLTPKGRLALALKLHKGWSTWVPHSIWAWLSRLRKGVLRFRYGHR